MFRDDYIMKIVAQATAVVGQIMAGRRAGRPEQAQAALDAALAELVGLSRAQLEETDAATLALLLARHETGGVGRALLAAALLQAQADLDVAADRDAAAVVGLRIKALDLRLHLAQGYQVHNTSLDGAVEQLVAQLDDYHLPGATLLTLYRYYEQTGQYARAEDRLFELLDGGYAFDHDLLDDGLAFYDRLMRKSEAELESGNFSRAEALAGFNELWERQSGAVAG